MCVFWRGGRGDGGGEEGEMGRKPNALPLGQTDSQKVWGKWDTLFKALKVCEN